MILFIRCKKAVRKLNAQFDELLKILKELVKAVRGRTAPQLTVKGGELTFDFPCHISITSQLQPEEFMANKTYTLPATTDDVAYLLAPIGEVRDAEGSLITDFEEKFESSDPAVVSVTPNDPAVLGAGITHFGAPGVAVVVHSISTKVGREKLLSVLDTNTFIVTPGAPLNVTGGEATFGDLIADPVEPTPEA